MMPAKNDFYLMWGDYYVAWPLSVPNQYADWMLVTFEQNEQSAIVELVPVRALSQSEVADLKRAPMLYWGMKLPKCEWSLVLWRPGQAQNALHVTNRSRHDPAHSIGV
jgi:hypothetical protein